MGMMMMIERSRAVALALALARRAAEEEKALWRISGGAVATVMLNFMMAAVTQALCGRLGPTQGAGAAMAGVGIQGLAYGLLLGLAAAAQTVCCQAFGAGGPTHMASLGLTCQRCMALSVAAAAALAPLYAMAGPALVALRVPADVAREAQVFARGLIPQLFAVALCNPMQRFLMAQNVVAPLAVLSLAAFGLHAAASWLLLCRLRHGLLAAAVTLSVSWWLLTAAIFAYIRLSPRCAGTWTGFSVKALHGMRSFLKLSLASAFMFCLEIWYNQSLVILAGFLPNADIAVNSVSVCMNYWIWEMQVILGISAAASVRVGNELGAQRPKAAQFAVAVAVATCVVFGSVTAAASLALRQLISRAFTRSKQVISAVSAMTPLLAISLLLNGIQPVLAAVAVGCGWQSYVAAVNAVCYYVIGLPLGMVLGFKAHLHAQGMWWGLICGVALQTLALIVVTLRTDWSREVKDTVDRLRKQSLQTDSCQTDADAPSRAHVSVTPL